MNNRRKNLPTLGLFLAISCSVMVSTNADANTGSPNWKPKVSERLVKLPGTFLKKAVDQDYAGSSLALAVNDLENQVHLKTQTLNDLQSAIGQASGEVNTELKHQYLAEKREYINMMARHLELRQKRLKTKQRVYERVLNKIKNEKEGRAVEVEVLKNKQEEVRKRFENAVSKVDMKLFGTPEGTVKSKYAKEYEKNFTAMGKLLRAINDHQMNVQPEINGKAVSKKEYVRQLLAENESEAALIEQEETILGYMAKLIALDAQVLSEEVGDADLVDSDVTQATKVSSAINFFVSN
jgi:hypothetical protein